MQRIEDDMVELGQASVETKGPIQVSLEDTPEAGRPEGGLTDD